jgi:hypothetical protein
MAVVFSVSSVYLLTRRAEPAADVETALAA